MVRSFDGTRLRVVLATLALLACMVTGYWTGTSIARLGGTRAGVHRPPMAARTMALTGLQPVADNGASCIFSLPEVFVDFSTQVATWTASVTCNTAMRRIEAFTNFSTWDPNATGTPSNPIGSLQQPPLVSRIGDQIVTNGSQVTVSGSATLTPGQQYGVQMVATALLFPPAQWQTAPVAPPSQCAGGHLPGPSVPCSTVTGPFST